MTEDSLSVLSTDPTYTTRTLHEDDATPELKRLKAQRGQKRGYATRLGKKLHTLQLKHPSAVSEATISSLSAELKDCVSKHDLLQQSIDECAADPEAYTPAAEREKHDTIHDELLADLDNLAIQSKAHRMPNCSTWSLDDFWLWTLRSPLKKRSTQLYPSLVRASPLLA